MKQVFLCCIFLVTLSCTNKPSKNNLETELQELFSKEFESEEPSPGGSILVKKGEEIIFLESYGLADLNTKEKITENTIFNTGSISKTFVSNGILILNERGMLSLEDSISNYFNDFEHPEIVSKIKIKHLLSHTSGLPDVRNVSENIDFFLTAKDTANFEPLKKVDRLNFQPGEKFEYSNPSFNGLALIIERVANKPWQRFIEENIFKPSEMSQSKITNGSYPDSGVAHAYIKDENGKYIESDYGEVPTFAAAGNGGIWSSVLDLANYENAIKRNVFLGKNLTDESRSVFTPETWTDTIRPITGYSWFVDEQDLTGQPVRFNVKFVNHTGSQGGFRAFYISIPEKDILFVGLFNRPFKNFRSLLFDAIAIFQNNNWIEKD